MAGAAPKIESFGLVPSPELERTIWESAEYVRGAADRLRDFYSPFTAGHPMPEGPPTLVFFDTEDREKLCVVDAERPIEDYLSCAAFTDEPVELVPVWALSPGDAGVAPRDALFIGTVSGKAPAMRSERGEDVYRGVLAHETAHFVSNGAFGLKYNGAVRQTAEPSEGTYGDLGRRLCSVYRRARKPSPTMTTYEYVAEFGAAFLEGGDPLIGLEEQKRALRFIARIGDPEMMAEDRLTGRVLSPREKQAWKERMTAFELIHVPGFAADEWFVEYGGVRPFLAAHPDALGDDFSRIRRDYILGRKLSPEILSSEFFKKF